MKNPEKLVAGTLGILVLFTFAGAMVTYKNSKNEINEQKQIEKNLAVLAAIQDTTQKISKPAWDNYSRSEEKYMTECTGKTLYNSEICEQLTINTNVYSALAKAADDIYFKSLLANDLKEVENYILQMIAFNAEASSEALSFLQHCQNLQIDNDSLCNGYATIRYKAQTRALVATEVAKKFNFPINSPN